MAIKKALLEKEPTTSNKSDRTTSKSSVKKDAEKSGPFSQPNARRTLYILTLAIVVGLVRWFSYSNITGGGGSGGIENNVDETLKSMLSIESRVSIKKDLNVAVGFGSCLDIFVSGKDLITNLYQPPEIPMHHENIRTQDELNEVFAYFFAEGAAAERYIDNRTFFQELVERARATQDSRKDVGGNAAVMAKRFILEGLDKVILGTQHSRASTSDYNDKLLISGPIVDTDDVHISIEYPAGERWGKYVAPRANRLIIHSDLYNPALESMDNFIDRMTSAKSLDLVVIGGLQMMDNIPVAIEVRKEKLEKLSRELSRLPPQKPRVHLELASFTEQALLKSIKELIIPRLDSVGMNEQELPTLLKYMSNEGVNIRSESYPRIATTLDQMRQLYQLLQKPSRGRLSRIHTHTLAFQAIMTKLNSGWNNTLTSSVKAALTAHRYTCGSHEIDMAKAKLIMDESYTTSKQGSRRRIPFNPKHPVVCWQEDIVVEGSELPLAGSQVSVKVETIEICVAPVLVCTKVKQTGGAGDNVSAAGLIYQF